MRPVRRCSERHVGEDRHRLLGADHGDRHDRHAGADRGLHEAAAAEASQPVALPVELAPALLALREHDRETTLVAQQPLGVGGVGRHQADLVGEHPDARVALEPVLAEHVQRARRGVLVADRLHDHRRVGRQRAGVVRHEQCAALGGHVLDALLLHPEPVAVVEVEQRLHQREDALRAAPVVEGSAGIGAWDQLAQLPQVEVGQLGRRLRRLAGELVEVGARIEVRPPRSRLLGPCVEFERPAEQRAARAQSPTTSWRSPSSSRSLLWRRSHD